MNFKIKWLVLSLSLFLLTAQSIHAQDLLKGKIFRIGTMGMCSSSDILRTIQTLELILVKGGKIASCGAGVEAASKVLEG